MAFDMASSTGPNVGALTPEEKNGAAKGGATLISRWLVHRAVEVALISSLSAPANRAAALEAPSPPRRPDFHEAAPQLKPPSDAKPPQVDAQPDLDCMTNLRAAEVVFETAEAPLGGLNGCAIDAPVRLVAITVGKRQVLLNAKPMLSCAFALRFSDFARNLLAPLGAGTLDGSLAAIETGPGYECRGRNQDPAAKLSAHGKGLALDVSAFVFSNGRKVSVDAQPDPQSAAYVKALRSAACGWFTTVLGPGSDPYHASHLHFDIEGHGSNGAYRICQ